MKVCTYRPLIAALLTAVLAGCVPARSPEPSVRPSVPDLPTGDKSAPMPAAGTCRLGNKDGQPLPDPTCTPGAINPAVTQGTIQDTVCKPGWAKTVRPPTSVTGRMKTSSARSYALAADQKGEYDHLVSLELGGAPDDPRNLWVEPGPIPNPKDTVENRLNQAVCSGLVPLATAQKAIAADWVTAVDDVGLQVTRGHVCLHDAPTRCASGRHGDTGEQLRTG
ncbi:MAG: hypothetical protein JOZ47_17615 [Kutzneria sp.]|nr:hypothetical protein [Kutzneria sp.]MBV9846864.1 hypothetical protein [Kutzneria sp.]